jgi:hypothetical protein
LRLARAWDFAPLTVQQWRPIARPDLARRQLVPREFALQALALNQTAEQTPRSVAAAVPVLGV